MPRNPARSPYRWSGVARRCLVALLCGLPVSVSAAAPDEARLTVRVLNLAGLDQRQLDQALHSARRLYEGAGVTIRWLMCGPCDAPLAANELWLRVVDSPLTTGMQLGWAALNPMTGRGRVATVYADRLARFAREAGRRVEPVLGLTIAHEVGHLVMGAAHTQGGVMRQNWSVADMPPDHELAFNWREAALLRAALSGSTMRVGQ